MEEFSYWHIDYLTCEGNIRWTTARAPLDCNESEISDRILTMDGNVGEDVAELISTHEISEVDEIDLGWDFTD